jgi:hypothetical protein
MVPRKLPDLPTRGGRCPRRAAVLSALPLWWDALLTFAGLWYISRARIKQQVGYIAADRNTCRSTANDQKPLASTDGLCAKRYPTSPKAREVKVKCDAMGRDSLKKYHLGIVLYGR